MVTSKIKFGIAVLVIFLLGVAYIIFLKPAQPIVDKATSPLTQTADNTKTNPTSSAITTTTGGFTMAKVSTHNSAQSCWTTISGNVYDLTSWIDQHPGGAQAILSLCGIDGTSAFLAQHGGQGKPERELATFLIGKLIK